MLLRTVREFSMHRGYINGNGQQIPSSAPSSCSHNGSCFSG